MESVSDRFGDADLDKLIRELASRSGGNARRSIRLRAWRLTVGASYAAKRCIDIFASGIGLVLLSPVYLAIAAAVKFTSPGPAYSARRAWGATAGTSSSTSSGA